MEKQNDNSDLYAPVPDKAMEKWLEEQRKDLERELEEVEYEYKD